MTKEQFNEIKERLAKKQIIKKVKNVQTTAI